MWWTEFLPVDLQVWFKGPRLAVLFVSRSSSSSSSTTSFPALGFTAACINLHTKDKLLKNSFTIFFFFCLITQWHSMLGTKFISSGGFLPYQNSTASPNRFLSIFGAQRDVIITSLSNVAWLHLPRNRPFVLSPWQPFRSRSPSWLHHRHPAFAHWQTPDSVCVPRYKRRCFFTAPHRQAGLPALFAPADPRKRCVWMPSHRGKREAWPAESRSLKEPLNLEPLPAIRSLCVQASQH